MLPQSLEGIVVEIHIYPEPCHIYFGNAPQSIRTDAIPSSAFSMTDSIDE